MEKIKKIGNKRRLTIPYQFLEKLNWDSQEEVEITIKDNKIIISKL